MTSFLKNKDVHEHFQKQFIKPRFSIKKDMLAPSLSTDRARLVGTAFDYLLRFYLQYLNPKAVCRRWVAEEAVNRLTTDQGLHRKGQEIIEGAKKNVAKFLKTGEITDELIKSAVLLAGLDPIVRAGVGQEHIGLVHNHDIQDLRKLMGVIEPQLFKSRKLCLLNPTFGKASLLVGGADADLVIDDTIIDIKTTKNLTCLPRDFHQLIGYYVLHQIGAIGDIKPNLKIKKIALYFSRYAYLHSFEIKEIIDPSTFPEFLKWFEKRARKERGPGFDKRLKTRRESSDRNVSSDLKKYTTERVTDAKGFSYYYKKWSNMKGETLSYCINNNNYTLIGPDGSGSISKAKALRWLKINT